MRVPDMRKPPVRLARKRKIENIWREVEIKKAQMQGVVITGVWRTPKFYLGVILVLAVLGGVVFRASDAALRNTQESHLMRAMRQVDVLAEALGRYHFHTGVYPSASQGLAALVRDPRVVPKWTGPYINQLRKDPWGSAYVYAPATTNGVPLLFSCGPDKTPGTRDDLRPELTRFDPGTAWTNGWVAAEERLPGIKVIKEISD